MRSSLYAFVAALLLAPSLAGAQSLSGDESSSNGNQQNSYGNQGYDSSNSGRSGGSMGGQLNPSGQGGQSSGNSSGNTSIIGNSEGNNFGNNNSNNFGNRNNSYNQYEQYRRRPLVPAPPSEFQKFVQAATGRLLPMFGARFFEDAENGGSPLDNVPVSADYIVGPGDELVIRAWGSIDVDYRAKVDRNGQVSLPRVGSFTIAGVKASELENHLRSQISRLYTNFNLSVALGQLRGVKVFVVGPAQRPGVFTLSSQSTLLSAVVAAGGPLPSGSMRKIGLRRDGRIVSELDVYEFLVQGDKSKDVQLAAGDVIVFNPVGPRLALTGAIDTPAIYELRSPQEPLREVLRYAGGAPLLANPNRVQIERVDALQTPAARFVEEFRLDGNGLQKPLRDGDVVTMLAISPQFANAVTLKGHVAQPLRYPWTPGMRIRDLIPDKEALISADFYRRKNLLVQVLPEDYRNARNSQYRDQRGGVGSRGATPSDRPGSQPTTPGAAAPNDPNADLQREAERNLARDSSNSNYMDPANAGVGGASSDRNGSRTDSYDGQRSLDDRTVRPRLSTTTLFDELNWDYAVIERLNRDQLNTQIIPFSLGKAILQNDPSQNIELQAGDVVTIYSQRDLRVPVGRQTRLVSIEGEIASPGVYQLLGGETLKQLLARAGGFTNEAYIYGLEFSREETRQRQRENLSQAVGRLESLAATQAAREAANRREDAAGAAVSNAATQAQLARLRRLEPNGRIALELSPDEATLAGLPDVPLEHGDRIVIPARPGFVTVAGAVVNSNAFLWKSGRNAGDYLRLAGLDEAADPDNMFILRADGTVSHAGDRRGFLGFGGGLTSQRLYPGDALIVPNQLDYETWGRVLVRNLKDFSQIFSQFGLGAAAIVALRNN